jgi:hypothetical protein
MNLQGEGPRQGHGDSVRGHRRPDERVRATEDRL